EAAEDQLRASRSWRHRRLFRRAAAFGRCGAGHRSRARWPLLGGSTDRGRRAVGDRRNSHAGGLVPARQETTAPYAPRAAEGAVMGKHPDDDLKKPPPGEEVDAVEREIDVLRRRTEDLLAELDVRVETRLDRAKAGVDKVKQGLTRARELADVRAQARAHPL